MPHTGMVWYIPPRSSLDACLQARLGGLQALVGASVHRLAVSGRRLLRRLSDAMNRPAEKPGSDSTRPSRTPVCLGKLSTANPERRLALVGFRPSSAPRCAGAPLVVGAVEVAAPLLTAFSSGSLPRVRPSMRRLSGSPSREPLAWENNSGTKPQSKGCLL
jgi:hypothetical protein